MILSADREREEKERVVKPPSLYKLCVDMSRTTLLPMDPEMHGLYYKW